IVGIHLLKLPQKGRELPDVLGRDGIRDDDVTPGAPVLPILLTQHSEGEPFLDVAKWNVELGRAIALVGGPLVRALHGFFHLCLTSKIATSLRRRSPRNGGAATYPRGRRARTPEAIPCRPKCRFRPSRSTPRLLPSYPCAPRSPSRPAFCWRAISAGE